MISSLSIAKVFAIIVAKFVYPWLKDCSISKVAQVPKSAIAIVLAAIPPRINLD